MPKNSISKLDYIEVLSELRILAKKMRENPSQSVLIKKAIEMVFRDYSYKAEPDVASEEAKQLFFNKNANIDQLRKHYQLHDLRKNKKVFVTFDHLTPINELIERLIRTDEDINEIFQMNKIAIITDEENARLGKKFRKNRPGGYDECYKIVGIALKF